MKELSIEQKAEAYDRALKVLHKYDGANIMFSQSLKEEMFPELKESEDERIRKEMLQIAKKSEDSFYMVMTPNKREKLIAWLEKQGEQKPADIIPQDFEKYVEHLLSLSDGEGHGSPAKVKEVSAELFKLAKLEQKPAWSEEDEVNLNEALSYIKDDALKEFIKSLRHQSTWKPTEEQMDALDYYANSLCTYCDR